MATSFRVLKDTISGSNDSLGRTKQTQQPTSAIKQSIMSTGTQFAPQTINNMPKQSRVATAQPQNPQAQLGVIDQSKQIADAYEQQKAAALAALRSAIEKSKTKYQATISSAPETFRPLKDQTTVARNEQLTQLRESMAEQGQSGGVSRSEELAVNTARENNLNALERQQQDVVTQANNAIAELEMSGQLEEAQIVADNANNKIRALMEEANRVSTETYNRGRTQIEDQRYQSQIDKQNEAQNRADFAATINPQEDLTQKINDLTAQGVPESDYRITELKKARVQKLAQMAQAEYEAELAKEKDQAKREEQAFEIAKWKFEQGMPADAITSTLLGIPVGSKIPSQQIKEAELAIQQRKAASSGSSSSGNKLTYNQALTQARQILGDGRSPNEYTNLALQLQSGTASSTTKTAPSVKTPDTNKATDALEYLDKLEAARDLVSINAFVQNNQNEIDRIVNDPYATEAEIEAAQAIQRKYYKYR